MVLDMLARLSETYNIYSPVTCCILAFSFFRTEWIFPTTFAIGFNRIYEIDFKMTR